MSKSDDEDFRRNRRRHQNREAARRCRQRRRDVSSNLIKEYQGLQSTNTQLIHEIRVLQKQKQELDDCLGRLTTHSSSSSSPSSSSSSSSSSHPSVPICRGLPRHLLLSPAHDVVNRCGESSSTMTTSSSGSGAGGSCEVFLRTTNCALQEETSKTVDVGTVGLSSSSVANGLNPCFQISSINSSFLPVKNFPQQRRVDRSPMKLRSAGLGMGCMMNEGEEEEEEGVDYRGAASITSEPRIIKDSTVAIRSTASAALQGLCFAFKDGGGDDDVMSGDSNLSTMSVGRWL